jgi:hypothetical protein
MITNTAGTTLTGLAEHLLVSWMDSGESTSDPGPAVLALLLPDDYRPLTEAALGVWLQGLRSAPTYSGLLDGGLAGRLAVFRLGTALLPRLSGLADATARSLARFAQRGAWPTSSRQFSDYDLISGPAGVLLGQCVTTPRLRQLVPFVNHLAALCADSDLSRLCCADDRVNTGLSHGVSGVAVALAAGYRADPSHELAATALRHVARWLIDEAYYDERGLLTWTRAGREGHSPVLEAGRRQGWCYGTPGVAWALYELSEALARTGTDEVGAEAGQLARCAMRSVVQHYDEDFHLGAGSAGSQLAICHGAAGVLAITDAFVTHAGFPEAGALRDRLSGYLLNRIEAVLKLGRTDMRLLCGACGTVAVLLTATGAPRTWLPMTGLR